MGGVTRLVKHDLNSYFNCMCIITRRHSQGAASDVDTLGSNRLSRCNWGAAAKEGAIGEQLLKQTHSGSSG